MLLSNRKEEGMVYMMIGSGWPIRMQSNYGNFDIKSSSQIIQHPGVLPETENMELKHGMNCCTSTLLKITCLQKGDLHDMGVFQHSGPRSCSYVIHGIYYVLYCMVRQANLYSMSTGSHGAFTDSRYTMVTSLLKKEWFSVL